MRAKRAIVNSVILSLLISVTLGAQVGSRVLNASLKRIDGKFLFQMELDRSTPPIASYDSTARAITVTLKGTALGDDVERSFKPDNQDQKLLGEVTVTEVEGSVKVRFHLGEYGDPSKFVVNTENTVVTAILFAEALAEPVFTVKPPEKDVLIPPFVEKTPGEEMVPAASDFFKNRPPVVVSEKGSVDIETTLPLETKKEELSTRPIPIPSFPLLQVPDKDLVSLNVKGLGLKEAVSLLVAPLGYNIIVDDSLAEKKVTLRLDQVPIGEALSLLTRAHGIAYVIHDRTVVIGSKENIEANFKELFETRTYNLNYADAKELKRLLVAMKLTSEGNVEVYAGESVILSGSEEGGSRVLGGGFRGIGQAGGGGGGGGGAGRTSDILPVFSNLSTARRNLLVITERPDKFPSIESLIKVIDVRPKVINIEAKIIEVSESGLKDLGILFNRSATLDAASVVVDWTESVPEGSPLGTPGTTVPPFRFRDFTRDPLLLSTQLNFLIDQGKARILSQPNVSTLDGEQAIWFAGDEIPFITRPAIQTGATFTPAEVDFKTVGIVLSIKPRIDSEGFVTLDISPSVSSLVQFIDVGQGAKAPQTRTRKASGKIRALSGATFALAGLRTETDKETIRKIPFLSEIPWIGRWLFTNTDTEKTTSELMIVITVTVQD